MGMQTTITAKLKLVTRPEQFCQLRLTQLAYRDALNQASQHAFAELRSLLTYKAALTGSVCISVDADHTSQCGPRCGHTSRQNRPQHGLRFMYQHCQFTPHSDLIGAR